MNSSVTSKNTGIIEENNIQLPINWNETYYKIKKNAGKKPLGKTNLSSQSLYEKDTKDFN